MIKPLDSFIIDSLYSNEEIYRSLEVGNAGGIRIKTTADGKTRRIVVMTSLPDAKALAENPYHDRVEGNILVYTAAGRMGDQEISGRNAAVPRQSNEIFPIWAFQLQSSRRDSSSGPKRWKFLGLLQHIRSYSEIQIDASGTKRSAFVFELYIHDQQKEIAVAFDRETIAMLFNNHSIEERIEIADQQIELTEPSIVDDRLDDSAELEQVRSLLLKQDPKQFENTIGELLLRTGFNDITVTRYSQDGGIDINARPGLASWPMRHILVQIQAKRWLHTVGRREVAELRGSILPNSIGCIVTTSYYSRAAVAEASSLGKVPIALINGRELASLIRRYGMNN
jgi:hypothetical protein